MLARTEQVEQLLLADPDVELVQTSIPGDADTGAQTLQAAFQGRSGNSARSPSASCRTTDLDAKTKELLDRPSAQAPAEGFDDRGRAAAEVRGRREG